MTSLKGKTLFISGASRGIGLAIALRAARDGANVAIAAKTAEPHPKLKGTIYTAADEIRAVVRQHLDQGAEIPALRRWALEAELSYDLYQGGKNGRARRSFPAEVLRHPQWLLTSPARARLRAACVRLLKSDKHRP